MADSPTRKQIVVGEQAFTFRVPTGKDMMEIGLRVRQLNGGPDMPQDVVYTYADQIATLSVLCESPKGYDFSTMQFHALNQLAGEVTEWIASFRRPVQDESGEVGAGTGN